MKASYAWEAEASWGGKGEKAVNALSCFNGFSAEPSSFPAEGPAVQTCCCPGTGKVGTLILLPLIVNKQTCAFFICLCLTHDTYPLTLSLSSH